MLAGSEWDDFAKTCALGDVETPDAFKEVLPQGTCKYIELDLYNKQHQHGIALIDLLVIYSNMSAHSSYDSTVMLTTIYI